MNFARHQKKHGSERQIITLMKMLQTFGTHSQRVIPQLELAARDFEDRKDNYPPRLGIKNTKLIRETSAEIKAPTLTKVTGPLGSHPRGRRDT